MNMSNFFWQRLARNAADAPGGTPSPAPVEPALDAPDLSFIPADFVVDGKPDTSRFASHYQELVAAQRPAPPDTYDFAMPADLKFEGVPEDFAINLTPEDPAFQPIYADLGAFLKEIGAPAEAGSKLAGFIGRYEAAKYAKGLAALQEEAKILGTPQQAETRVAAVLRKLETMLPADHVDALRGISTSAKAVLALEKLVGPKDMAAAPAMPPGAGENLTPYQRLQRANAQSARAV